MDIFIEKNGQQTGPFAEVTVRSMLNTGELAPTDMAWRQGTEAWAPVGNLLRETTPTENIGSAGNIGVETSREERDGDFLNIDAGVAFGMADGGDIGIARTISLFKSLDYGFLLPFKKILTQGLLRKKAVRWVLSFGLFPLLLMLLSQRLGWGFEQSAWFLGGYFSLFWAFYFYSLLRPTGTVWKRGLKWAGFTVIVGMPYLLGFAQNLPIIRDFYGHAGDDFDGTSLIYRACGFVFIVGVLEETCKALPLLLFAIRKNEILPLKNGIFLGMMSGFGFAVSEAVGYSIKYWTNGANFSEATILQAVHSSLNWYGGVDSDKLAQSIDASSSGLVEVYGQLVMVQLVRFMTLPLLHAVWAGIVGWFIAIASQRKDNRWPVIVVGILLAAVLHGLFDTFSSGFLGLALAATGILIFMAYVMHGEEQLPQVPGNTIVTQNANPVKPPDNRFNGNMEN